MQEFFLGSGGMFGLLQALVGEGLPGSTPCVAVGNALLQGPVVLHIPQAVVNRIKDKAMTGDQGVVQLCVDMYRSAQLTDNATRCDSVCKTTMEVLVLTSKYCLTLSGFYAFCMCV